MSVGQFHSQLEKFLTEQGIELQELIYGATNPIALEKKWMETFSEKEFAEFGLLKYFPRMVRGMPRLYKRDGSQCKIKKAFSDLGTLKRLGAEKAFFSLYENIEPTKGAKLAIFSWVMNDGWGDLIAGLELAQILQERFHLLEIRWVVLLSEKREVPEFNDSFKIHWVVNDLNEEALAALRTSDCIVQIPTYYPKTEDLKEILNKIKLSSPAPLWIEVGEYGFVESDWFHPKSGRWSLGLHCLEKGILIHKSKSATFAEIKNEVLLNQLFGTAAPGPVEVEKYQEKNAFYLAYLTSGAGGLVYLQAVIKAHELDEKNIDLCTPDVQWLIELIDGGKLSTIENLREVEIYFAGQNYTAKGNQQGKRVRIICPGKISDSDFRGLVRLSGEFVGVRGDQSFSEAVCANKVYFYDGREHAEHFIRDLVALAENRIGAHRTALSIFRAIRKAHLYNLPEETGEWVEESHFLERSSLLELGLQVGLALQDSDAIAGFKKLNRVITDEYSANEFLCNLVQRALYHKIRPDIAIVEEQALASFMKGGITFAECFFRLASDLQLEKKAPLWKIKHVNSQENHDLHARLGKELRSLMHLCARDEIQSKAEEIHQLAHAIGGSLSKEAETLSRHVRMLIDLSKQVSEIALHLEQQTREI